MVVSEDEGSAWRSIDLGTDADLYGIAQHGAWLVVVGDETIVARQPDGVWTEPPAPPGGWGRLRGTYADELRVYAVGLDGVAWSAVEPGEWVAEDVGVDTDLLAVDRLRGFLGDPDRVAIVGSGGTLIVGGHELGWARIATKTTADLVDVSNSAILTADGEVLMYDDGKLSSINGFSGPQALYSYGGYGGRFTVVGDGGVAQRAYNLVCML